MQSVTKVNWPTASPAGPFLPMLRVSHRYPSLTRTLDRHVLANPSSVFSSLGPIASVLSPDYLRWCICYRPTNIASKQVQHGHQNCTWIRLYNHPIASPFYRNSLKRCIVHQERRVHGLWAYHDLPSVSLVPCWAIRIAVKWNHQSQ